MHPSILYFASRFFAAAAMTSVRATLGWHVYDLTHSKVTLGLIGLFQFIPAVACSLAGGLAADRHDRTAIVKRAQLGAVCVSPALVLGTAYETISAPMLLGTAAVLAALSAFEQPSRASLLISLVPREEFPRAVTRAATLQALAFAAGPAIAGLLIAWRGPTLAYSAHGLFLLISALLVARLPSTRGSGGTKGVLASLLEGLEFVRSHRIVLACMSIDMFAVILGGATALLPVFAEDILKVGPTGFGALSASLELGALAMSLMLAARKPIRRSGRALLIAVAVFGLATIAFGLSRWFPLSLLAYGLVGAADQVSVVLRHTVVQLSTPDEVRGRVSSINMLFIQASNQLVAFESGIAAALLGAPVAVVLGGIGAILVSAYYAIRVPELRNYRVAVDH